MPMSQVKKAEYNRKYYQEHTKLGILPTSKIPNASVKIPSSTPSGILTPVQIPNDSHKPGVRHLDAINKIPSKIPNDPLKELMSKLPTL